MPAMSNQLSYLFLWTKNIGANFSSVWEMYFLRFCPFPLRSPLALLWFIGLFQSPSQFPFFISSNINRELLNTYSCVLSSLNTKEDLKERAALVNDEWLCSSACTLVCLFSSLHTECSSSQGHWVSSWNLMDGNRQHQSSGFQLPPLLQWATFSRCTWENQFLLVKIALCFRAHKTALGGESGLIVFPFYLAFELVWHDRIFFIYIFFWEDPVKNI